MEAASHTHEHHEHHEHHEMPTSGRELTSVAFSATLHCLTGCAIGEMLGIERVPMEFESGDGRHRIKIGDDTEVAVEDVVPFGIEDGKAAELSGIFHPGGSTLTIAQATTSRVSAFGLEFENQGKSAFSRPFVWSG